jgi:hypothetical protein
MKQSGSHGKEFTHNNRGTVGSGVFYAVLAGMLIGARVHSCKGVCEEKT